MVRSEDMKVTLRVLKAFFLTIRNLFSLSLWYGIGTFFVLYIIGCTIFMSMTYIGGGVCLAIKKLLDWINWVLRKLLFSKSHKIDVEAITALSGLVDGSCVHFKDIPYTLRYWLSRSLGNTLCKEILWYESITLTRIFVAYPLSFLYVEVGTMPGQMCDLGLEWDMCAGVIGTKAVLDFLMKKGLWIFLGLFIVGWPITKCFLSFVWKSFTFLIRKLHLKLYMSHPRLKSQEKKRLAGMALPL